VPDGMLAASSDAVKASCRASARRPFRGGASDERGAGDHMKPQTVANAAKLIKTGEASELGHESPALA